MNLHVSSSGIRGTRRTDEASAASGNRHRGRTENLGRHRGSKAEPSAAGGPVQRSLDVLEGPVLARCPSCRGTFSTDRTGAQDCPVCGKPLVVPPPAGDVQAGSQPPAASPSEPEAQPGTPWERRAELGAPRALWDTVIQALFEPGRLFRSARLDRGPAQLGFAVLTASAGWIAEQLIDQFLLRNWTQTMLERLARNGPMAAYWQSLASSVPQTSPRSAVPRMVFTPLIVLVLVYLNAALTHGAAALLGQARRGFAATFAACAYACAPLLLLALPGCGSIVGLVWTVVLTGIGLQGTHRMPTRSAVAAVLAPYALLCCGACALGVVGGMAALRGVP
jgi:Yip1 domain